MKSRATGKVEVTRHVISCELLLNDGSLSYFVIDMVLIYFFTETKKNKTEMNYCSEILSYFPAIKPKRTDLLSLEGYPFLEQKKSLQ